MNTFFRSVRHHERPKNYFKYRESKFWFHRELITKYEHDKLSHEEIFASNKLVVDYSRLKHTRLRHRRFRYQ